MFKSGEFGISDDIARKYGFLGAGKATNATKKEDEIDEEDDDEDYTYEYVDEDEEEEELSDIPDDEENKQEKKDDENKKKVEEELRKKKEIEEAEARKKKKEEEDHKKQKEAEEIKKKQEDEEQRKKEDLNKRLKKEKNDDEKKAKSKTQTEKATSKNNPKSEDKVKNETISKPAASKRMESESPVRRRQNAPDNAKAVNTSEAGKKAPSAKSRAKSVVIDEKRNVEVTPSGDVIKAAASTDRLNSSPSSSVKPAAMTAVPAKKPQDDSYAPMLVIPQGKPVIPPLLPRSASRPSRVNIPARSTAVTKALWEKKVEDEVKPPPVSRANIEMLRDPWLRRVSQAAEIVRENARSTSVGPSGARPAMRSGSIPATKATEQSASDDDKSAASGAAPTMSAREKIMAQMQQYAHIAPKPVFAVAAIKPKPKPPPPPPPPPSLPSKEEISKSKPATDKVLTAKMSSKTSDQKAVSKPSAATAVKKPETKASAKKSESTQKDTHPDKKKAADAKNKKEAEEKKKTEEAEAKKKKEAAETKKETKKDEIKSSKDKAENLDDEEYDDEDWEYEYEDEDEEEMEEDEENKEKKASEAEDEAEDESVDEAEADDEEVGEVEKPKRRRRLQRRVVVRRRPIKRAAKKPPVEPEEPKKKRWVAPPRPPPEPIEMPPQVKHLYEVLKEEGISPTKRYAKKAKTEVMIPFIIPWEQAASLEGQAGMGAFGTHRDPKIDIADGNLTLIQGELKSENVLPLFEENVKKFASQKGLTSFGSHRRNVDNIVDHHIYESEDKKTISETIIPKIALGSLVDQRNMTPFGAYRTQTAKVEYAKGMKEGCEAKSNTFLSRQFKPNSDEKAGSRIIDCRRPIVQSIEGAERVDRMSETIVPRIFSNDFIHIKSGADFGAFRPVIQKSKGGYKMTRDEEILCKLVIPYQTAPSLPT